MNGLVRPYREQADPRVALVLATGSYEDERLAALRAPALDAVGMGEVLADPGIGGFDVTTVIDRPEYDVRRTVDRFLDARGFDDLVVLYLSCHGVLDARGRLYFATADTERDRLASTAIEAAWLLDRLDECRAGRQVLILDCCFSGAFDQRAKGDTDVDLGRRLVGSGRGRAVLTASRATEYSFEGEVLVEGGGTVFTAALVDGLRTGAADRNHTGYVTVEDAYQYAADQVRLRDGSAQTPQRWLYGGEDTIVLARNPNGAPVVAAGLPESLDLSLNSPYPAIRQAAVRTLGEWLTSADPREVLAAQQTLQLVATQDSPIVAATARELLQAAEPEPPAPMPVRPVPHGLALLPMYVVVDVSASMAGARLDAVNQVLPELVDGMQLQPVVMDRVHLCVIEFSDDARVATPLTGLANLTHMPVLAARGGTSYRAAFRLLHERITRDHADLLNSGHPVSGAVVMFLTDGSSTDEWRDVYDSLVRNAPTTLTVLAIGMGEALRTEMLWMTLHPGVSTKSRSDIPVYGIPAVLRRVVESVAEDRIADDDFV